MPSTDFLAASPVTFSKIERDNITALVDCAWQRKQRDEFRCFDSGRAERRTGRSARAILFTLLICWLQGYPINMIYMLCCLAAVRRNTTSGAEWKRVAQVALNTICSVLKKTQASGVQNGVLRRHMQCTAAPEAEYVLAAMEILVYSTTWRLFAT